SQQAQRDVNHEGHGGPRRKRRTPPRHRKPGPAESQQWISSKFRFDKSRHRTSNRSQKSTQHKGNSTAGPVENLESFDDRAQKHRAHGSYQGQIRDQSPGNRHPTSLTRATTLTL